MLTHIRVSSSERVKSGSLQQASEASGGSLWLKQSKSSNHNLIQSQSFSSHWKISTSGVSLQSIATTPPAKLPSLHCHCHYHHTRRTYLLISKRNLSAFAIWSISCSCSLSIWTSSTVGTNFKSWRIKKDDRHSTNTISRMSSLNKYNFWDYHDSTYTIFGTIMTQLIYNYRDYHSS